MKIKQLKKITIGDVVWYIKWDKNVSGASFGYATDELQSELIIGIRTIKTNPEHVLAILIHELKEILHVEQHTRFSCGDAEGLYEFHYSHRDHTNLCCRLAGLLTQFIE